MADLAALVNEQEVRDLSVTTSVSTAGYTVGVYAIDPSGTATLVGSTDGQNANTAMTISCTFALVPATYKIQVVAGLGVLANPLTIFPDDDDQDFFITVREIEALDVVE